MRPMKFLGEVLRDVRYAARVVMRQPGTTLIIVVSLALGIGANTLVFSLVNAILLRSLPYPEPDRLVRVAQQLAALIASGTESSRLRWRFGAQGPRSQPRWVYSGTDS